MFDVVRSSIVWNGKNLTIETGKIARQADMSVVVRYGDTTVLCAVTKSDTQSDGVSFFPLVINYQERFYAACKFPGGFVKREGKPSDRETIISRLIDRSVRPLFPGDFFNEVQIVCTVLSFDPDSAPDIASVIGVSAALCASSVPFDTPVAMCSVSIDDAGEFISNNSLNCDKNIGKLDLLVSGTKDNVLMVESGSDELGCDEIVDAILFGHRQIAFVTAMIEDFVSKCKKQKVGCSGFLVERDKLVAFIMSDYESEICEALSVSVKQERISRLACVENMVVQKYCDSYHESVISSAFNACKSSIMRRSIIEDKRRIDGRSFTDIRQINCEIDVLPIVHGSALFTRGETQSLVSVTLGGASDKQVIDDLYGERKEIFVLHYNFPPFAVGECGRLGAPSRREIGHGKLACRALRPVLPDASLFPYSIRVVSEIMESNGSSSMATVCGSSMALMTSGVPVRSSVAGIAMGLIKDGDDYVILSDIMGEEDALGDMDFKVAGTRNGITALQMDLKIDGIGHDILRKAVHQAWIGIQEILCIMDSAISVHKKSVHENAPRIENIRIPKDKVRDLIGPGGKNIKEICDKTGAKIEIDDSGCVSVFASTKKSLDTAIQKVMSVCAKCEIGDIVDCTVVKITDFGAFVTVGLKDGLIHISNISEKRVSNVEDVLSIGQVVKAKIIGLDDRGRLKLSMSL